jgi:hypothetical protein
MLFRLCLEILEIKITVVMSLYSDNFEAGHNRRLQTISAGHAKNVEGTYCRIGSMSTQWNKADIPVTLAA